MAKMKISRSSSNNKNNVSSTAVPKPPPAPAAAPVPLVLRRWHDPTAVSNKFGKWKVVRHRPTSLESKEKMSIPLELGGVVTIYPNLVDQTLRNQITNEVLTYSSSSPPNQDNNNEQEPHQWSLFRQYEVQNNNEPRWNCFLHRNAKSSSTSSSSSSQPGYRYGNVTMTARPYDNLPITDQFTKDMEQLYLKSIGHKNGKSNYTPNTDPSESSPEDSVFNIGAHVVLYRDASDSMGDHADDDQGESYILTTILSQQHARYITIKPKPECRDASKNIREMHYKLLLHEGDAYSMDGIMQQFYLHGVPKNPNDVKTESELLQATENYYNHQYQRLVIVFRRGEYKEFTKDSGRPVTHHELQHAPLENYKKREYTFGSIPKLTEYHLYTRRQLFNIGAHRAPQRGVSGKKKIGCNAVVVSGLAHINDSYDDYDILNYCATTQEGANSLVTSYKEGKLIRVFRSSKYESKYRANYNGKDTKYRYDGLYQINNACYISEPQKKTIFTFEMSKK